MYVHSTESQLADLIAHAATSDGEIVMLNLLRFVEAANPGFGCDGMTGREAYAEYGKRLSEMDPPFPGRPLWMGNAQTGVIGPDDEQWDEVILVHYDNGQTFLDMVNSESYQAASPARDAAIADSRLVLMNELLHDKS